MTYTSPWYRSCILLAIIGCITCATYYLVRACYDYYKTYTSLRETIEINVKQETKQAATEINNFIALLKPRVQDVIHQISDSTITQDAIEKILAQKPPEIFGLGIAYAPFTSPVTKRLYAPYLFEKKGKNTLLDIATDLNYDDPEYAWFYHPFTRGPGYTPAYIAPQSKATLIQYGAPFFLPDTDQPRGIVFANQSVAHLNHFLNTRYDKSNGYWFIVSQTGDYLAHPLSYAKDHVNAFTVATKYEQPALAQALHTALAGHDAFVTYMNEITHSPSWLCATYIPEIKGALCRVFDLSEIYTVPINALSLTTIVRNQVRTIAFWTLIIFLLIVFFIVCLVEPTPLIGWLLAIATALCATIYTVVLWYISCQHPEYTDTLTPIRGTLSLNSMLAQSFSPPKDNFSIPTGIFVNSLALRSADEIEISCFIWQRYTNNHALAREEGFILPQAKAMTIQEVQRKKWSDGYTILWHVDALLHQKLDYTRYPFDVKDIEIAIWPREFNKNSILIPDFTSYLLYNPHSLPGISNTAYLEGWHIKASYFGYESLSHFTLFGMYKQGAFGPYKEATHFDMPELCFNISIQRNLLDMMIEDLLPLLVVALFLFLALITAEQQGYAILASIASIFFGLVVSHLNFQAKITRYQLIYFEYFYLILYALTLLVTISSVIYVLKANIPFFQYRNNLISKLLYWPLLSITLALVSWIYLA